MTFFAITLLLGLAFLGVEIYEFTHYVHVGAGLQVSAFTGILLTTLGTHGAHVTLGLFWGLFIILQVKKHGLTPKTANKVIHLFTLLAFLRCRLDLHFQLHLFERNDVT